MSHASKLFPAILLLLPLAHAQLIPAGQLIPRTAKPPVVFMNGYEATCPSPFADTFDRFDQILQATGRVSLFFDNCTFSGKPSIEDLGNDFRTYLGGLKYTDGAAVPQVDVVAHSMGGLIVRSYLAGKQNAPGVFQPPATIGVRKAVFIATPHFGTSIAIVFGSDMQTTELGTGSAFVYDLATWNQSTDDLRGIDALDVIGNGGNGRVSGQASDDGVASLTSASLAFAAPGRTRVIPYCHTGPGLITLANLCPPGAPGIAHASSATDSNAQIVVSFLNDTPDWQTIGQAPDQNPLLSTQGGLILRARTQDDQVTNVQSASASKALSLQSSNIPYSEFLPSGTQNISVTSSAGTLQSTINLPAGSTSAILVKNGPVIARVLPAAAAVFPLNVAPGTYISIYGSALATATTPAVSLPLPPTLGGTQVLVNGTPIPLGIVSPTQINGILPLSATGLVTLTVTGATGKNTVNVFIQPAVPALFTQDASGSGAASALNAVTGALITASAPLHGGDYVSLYLTGLGTKTTSGSFQVAAIQPTVTVAGQPCALQFAGAAPIYDGLDQINCQIPMGLAANAAAPVIVTSNGRNSNTATLALQ